MVWENFHHKRLYQEAISAGPDPFAAAGNLSRVFHQLARAWICFLGASASSLGYRGGCRFGCIAVDVFHCAWLSDRKHRFWTASIASFNRGCLSSRTISRWGSFEISDSGFVRGDGCAVRFPLWAGSRSCAGALVAAVAKPRACHRGAAIDGGTANSPWRLDRVFALRAFRGSHHNDRRLWFWRGPCGCRRPRSIWRSGL